MHIQPVSTRFRQINRGSALAVLAILVVAMLALVAGSFNGPEPVPAASLQNGDLALYGRIVDRLQQGQRFSLQRGRVGDVGLQDARQLQQVGKLHAQVREMAIEALRQRTELGHQGFVDGQRPAAFGRAQAQHQVELAAADPRGDALAQLRLEVAQFLGQAHAHFQEAVVDRAQLAAEGAPGGGALAAGKGGHASDHGVGVSGKARMVP